MNREDITRWATHCKMPYDYVTGEIVQIEKLEAFAALVAADERKRVRSAMKKAHHRMSAYLVAAEREACAQVAEETVCDTHLPTGVKIYGSRAAVAIRARGKA